MKKIIILLLALLMSACSAVKPSETLSSMQTEPTAETTVTETTIPKETTEPTPKETEAVSETSKEKTTESPVTEQPEQKPVPDTTAVATVEAPVEPIKAETTTELLTTQEMPVETVEEDKPTELSETVETLPESVTEPPKVEFDINYWISFARSYALQIGLEIDETAVDCWDNPTTANTDCIYLERDLTHRLDRYNRDDDITAVNIWAVSLGYVVEGRFAEATLTDKDKTLTDTMEDIINDEFTDLTVSKEDPKIKPKPVRSTAGNER